MTKLERRIAYLRDCAKEDMFNYQEQGEPFLEHHAEGMSIAYEMALQIIREEMASEDSDS